MGLSKDKPALSPQTHPAYCAALTGLSQSYLQLKIAVQQFFLSLGSRACTFYQKTSLDDQLCQLAWRHKLLSIKACPVDPCWIWKTGSLPDWAREAQSDGRLQMIVYQFNAGMPPSSLTTASAMKMVTGARCRRLETDAALTAMCRRAGFHATETAVTVGYIDAEKVLQSTGLDACRRAAVRTGYLLTDTPIEV